ncbi:MAG: hypothetical protein IJD62_01180 [Oscillospiraceae bacterium]|nr:hypothetical protein [Oscillospiraceae bacterium]MBQ3560470.1 hypothetical protein [Oscillospiraceae bacterium]
MKFSVLLRFRNKSVLRRQYFLLQVLLYNSRQKQKAKRQLSGKAKIFSYVLLLSKKISSIKSLSGAKMLQIL